MTVVFREIEDSSLLLGDVCLRACAGLSKHRLCRYRKRFFEGDADGTQLVDASFLGCSRGDQALIDEALRIRSAAYSPTGSASYPTQAVGRPVLIATDLTRTAD